MRLENLRDMGKDDLLAMLGLETKRGFFATVLPGVGLVGAGILIGAGLGIMLAPRSGRELRRELVDRYGSKLPGMQASDAAHPTM